MVSRTGFDGGMDLPHGAFGDHGHDPAVAQVLAVGACGVGLVAQQRLWSGAGSSGFDPGDAEAGQRDHQRAAPAVDQRVNFGAQPVAGPADAVIVRFVPQVQADSCSSVVPPVGDVAVTDDLAALAACWCARAIVELLGLGATARSPIPFGCRWLGGGSAKPPRMLVLVSGLGWPWRALRRGLQGAWPASRAGSSVRSDSCHGQGHVGALGT